ncbi:MAG: SH3 domain-containing protein [Caldilineaceae bacterium]
MFENKFVLLLISLTWMAGLFGTLLALVYLNRYRQRHWWNQGYAYHVPRTLAPLYSTMVLLCGGLGLHAYAANQSVSLGVAAIWWLLALFFAVRLLDVLMIGAEDGWDEPLTAAPVAATTPWWQKIGWSAAAFLLLLVNVVVLGWWSSVQLNAGALNLALAARLGPAAALVQRATPTPWQVTLASGAVAQLLTPQLYLTLAPTATAGLAVEEAVTPTALLSARLAAVVTLEPATLRVTPTLDDSHSGSGGVLTATQPLTPILTVTTPVTNVLTSAVVTPTPTALAAPTVRVIVRSTYGANARQAPALTAEILTVLPDAVVVTGVGRTADNKWLQIRLDDDSRAWIAAEVVEVEGAMETLPIL